jgi:hypothetical protein
VFTALDDSISFLSQHAPGLTSAALAIGGIALALSKLQLLGSVLKLTGLTAAATGFMSIARAAGAANVAEKGMLATQVAFESITPWGWAILGTAALAGLVLWLGRTSTAGKAVVSSLEAQNQAVGFNTAGYVAAAKAIGQANDAQSRTVVTAHGVITSVGSLTGATQTYVQAQKDLTAAGRNQEAFLTALEVKYNITRDSAVSLTTHSGALASQVNKGGQAMQNTLTATEAWANANVSARTPVTQLTADLADFSNQTLTATLRQKGLTDALKLFFDPAVKADQDIITMKNDQVAMATALAASAGKTGLLTTAQRTARGAFETYINDVATAAQDAFAATGKTSSYTKIIHDALPTLYSAAAGNRTLRGEVQRLIDTMHGLTPEKVSIAVAASGSWNVIQGSGGPPSIKAPGAARGMFVAQGRAGVDDQLIRAQRGELVVPTSMVRAGAVDHLRGRIPGFASGGVVGSYRGTVPGTSRFLGIEDVATLTAIERSVALATLAGIGSARSQHFASGGLGRSSLRQIEDWWTGAGGPGGLMAHIAAAITGAESGFNPGIVQQGQPYATTGWGLWQITPGNSEPQAGIDRQLLNGPANARAAVAKFSQAGGFSPWTTFMDGAYLKFMDSGGVLEPGLNHVYNGTGRPEPLVPAGNTYNITVNVPPGANKAETGRVIVELIEAFEKRSGKGWRR